MSADTELAGAPVALQSIDLQIEVMRSSDIISSLLQKTATAGLSLCRTPVDKLEMRCFLRQRYAIFCGRHHRLFGLSQLTMDDLLAENFVSFTSDQIGDSLSPLTVFRDQRGFTGRIVASSPSLDEVRRLIFAGYGIGCLPEHAVREDLAKQRLWRLPPEEGLADVDIHLLWHRERKMNAAEQAFFDAMERCMQRYALAERLCIDLPEDRDYATAAGFVLAAMRKLPTVGEHFEEQGWRFEIVDMDGRKIDKLLVVRASG